MADVNVSMGVDNTGALKSLKQVEKGIDNLVSKFGKLKSVAVGITVNTGNAIKEINAIQAKLNGLNASVSGSIKLNNAGAIASIKEVQSKISGLSTSVTGTIKLDNSEAIAAIKEVQSKISGLSTSVTGTIKLDNSSALNAINEVQSKISSLSTSVTGTIKLDNTAAIASINEVRSKLASLNLTTAGNIGIDNSSAIAAINEVRSRISSLDNQIDDDHTIRVDTDDAVKSVKKLDGGVDALNNTMKGLKTAIAGLALGSFVQALATYATTITNAANATDLSTASVKAFSDAVVASGGDAKGAVEDLTEFTAKIYDAKNGSDETAKMFASLGISLSRLRTMSNQEILETTLKGLSKMEDSTQRNKIAMELLGGEMKKVSAIDVAKGYQGNMGTTQNRDASAAIESMGKAQKNLAGIFKDVGNEIIIAIKPIADFASELRVSHDAIVKTIAFLKELGYWIITIGSFFLGGAIVKVIMKIATSLGTMATGLGTLVGAISGTSAPLIRFGANLENIGMKMKMFGGGGMDKALKFLDGAKTKLAGLSSGTTAFSTQTRIVEGASRSYEALASKLNMVKAAMSVIVGVGITFKDFFVAIWTGEGALNSVEIAIHSVIKGIKNLGSGFVTTTNQLNDFLKTVPVIGMFLTALESIINGVAWAFKDLFSDAQGGGKIMNALGASLEFVARGFGELLNLPTNIIGSLIGYGWNEAMGLGDGILNLAKKAEEARKGLKPATVDPSENNAEMAKLKRQQDQAQKTAKAAKAAVKQESEEYKKLRMEVASVGKQFSDNNDLKLQDLAFQTRLVGKTEDQKEALQASYDLTKSYDAVIAGLVQKQKEWAIGTEEQKGAAGLITAEIKRVTTEYETQLGLVGEYTVKLQSTKLLEQDRLNTQQNITDEINKQIERQAALGDILRGINDKTVDMKFEASQQGKSPFAQQVAQINEDARKAALEAGRAFAAGFEDSGDGLTVDKANELAAGLDKIAQKYRGIASAQLATLNESRTWKSGWTEAFEAYADSATNSANMARDAFASFSSGMDRMIDTFVTTGKLAFGDFARSVIADLIKIELKAQAMEALKMLTGGNGISGAMSTIGGFFGGNGGFGTGSGFGNQDFGGFFANGGQPPLGKASIVGENGPELFVPKSAGTIVPNGGFGGATVQQPIINNNTYVTNNVSAVDAKSVAQLFQENRKQLFGVIETARKEMPGRTR